MNRSEIRKHSKVSVYQLVPLNTIKILKTSADDKTQLPSDDKTCEDMPGHPGYTINGHTAFNVAKFNDIGYVKYGTNFDDELIKIDNAFFDDDNKYKISNNCVELCSNVHMTFYKDNIASTQIMRTQKIPMMHCVFVYHRSIVITKLFDIVLYFSITNAKNIKSFDKLFKSNIYGTYSLEIVFDNKKEVLPLNNELWDETDVIKSVMKNIIKFSHTEQMKEIIDIEIDKRDDERIKKYEKKICYDYVIPENPIDFSKLVEEYKNVKNNGNINDENSKNPKSPDDIYKKYFT